MGTLCIGTTHCLNKVIFPITCGHLKIFHLQDCSDTTNSPQQKLFVKLQQLSRLLKREECQVVNWLQAKGFGGSLSCCYKIIYQPRAPHINLSSILTSAENWIFISAESTWKLIETDNLKDRKENTVKAYTVLRLKDKKLLVVDQQISCFFFPQFSRWW